jgi:excisionase family DNA binding protein
MTNKPKEYTRQPFPKTYTEANGAIPASGFEGHERMVSVAVFCDRYGIGKTMAYAEMASGRLRFCKVGRSRRIRLDDAEAWSISTRQPLPTNCDPSTAGVA